MGGHRVGPGTKHHFLVGSCLSWMQRCDGNGAFTAAPARVNERAPSAIPLGGASRHALRRAGVAEHLRRAPSRQLLSWRYPSFFVQQTLRRALGEILHWETPHHNTP
eukprot:scaffold30166_cov132-Isochrysis_galbana.AAC.2